MSSSLLSFVLPGVHHETRQDAEEDTPLRTRGGTRLVASPQQGEVGPHRVVQRPRVPDGPVPAAPAGPDGSDESRFGARSSGARGQSGLPRGRCGKVLPSRARRRPRDRAPLFVTASYGLGAAEAVRLRLDDLDWRNLALLIVPPKTVAIEDLLQSRWPTDRVELTVGQSSGGRVRSCGRRRLSRPGGARPSTEMSVSFVDAHRGAAGSSRSAACCRLPRRRTTSRRRVNRIRASCQSA